MKALSVLCALMVMACGTGTEPEASAASCPPGWNTAAFFDVASPADIAACLAAGENPNAKSPDGRTPLHFAATRDNPAIIMALIAGGARTTTQSAEGLTPLCAAAKDGQSVPVVQALIDGGASVDGICRMQWGPNPIGPNATALCIASAWNSAEIVRTFLEAGASVELVCSRPGDVSNIEGPVSALAWAEYSLYTGKLRGDHAAGQAAAQAVLDMLIAAGAKRRNAP